MAEFSEQRYYEAYKAIRNKLRKFDAATLIETCLRYLNKPAKDEIQQLQKHPWLVLLLIKWVLVDDQNQDPGRKIPAEKDAIQILQSVIDLGSKVRMPTQFQHHTLFFRALAYQQFIYQHKFALSHLARQLILFADLPERHFFKSKFRELTGIEIETFLELSIVLLVRFVTDNHDSISPAYFSPLQSKYGKQAVSLFLQAISKTLPEIKALLRQREDGRRPAAEYYEQTPFVAYPLIEKEGNVFRCIERHILFRCIEHYVYDRMKMWDAQQFMNEFGLIFERYVERAIDYMGLPYIDEAALKQLVGENGKVIDFIIVDDTANVFVDAKAVEMAYQGKVAYLSEAVESRVGSILKAVEQAHDVIVRLDQRKPSHPFIAPKKRNYLIVVTFKDLYLGNGRTLHEGVAKDSLDAIYAKYGGHATIPLENMYFLNVADFEMFAEAVRTKKIGLAQGLEKAKADDSDARTRKFEFGMHIADWKTELHIPGYLHERFDAEFDKLASLFPEAIGQTKTVRVD